MFQRRRPPAEAETLHGDWHLPRTRSVHKTILRGHAASLHITLHVVLKLFYDARPTTFDAALRQFRLLIGLWS